MNEELRPYHEVANIFPLMTGIDFDELKSDISANGLREAIWLHSDGRIIDGRNRHRACLETGVQPFFKTWNGDGSLVGFVISLNLHRRHLSSGQKAMVAVDILPMLEAEARERQRSAGIDFGKSHPKLVANLPQALASEHSQKSRDIAAKQVGVASRYVQDAKKIAEKSPRIAHLVREDTLNMHEAKTIMSMPDEKQETILDLLKSGSTATVKDAIRHISKEEKLKAAQSVCTLPDKQYNVIYVDPPWEYSNTGVNGAAEHHYNTMSIAELEALPESINLSISKNAVMFMWITNPLMAEAFHLIEKWGFTYKTNIVWVKTELKKPGSGFYVRGRHELLFICTKGSFTPLDENISPPIGSVVSSPVMEHSRKPTVFYEIIEKLYPKCSYIELFARSNREGWDSWGNETDKFPETN